MASIRIESQFSKIIYSLKYSACIFDKEQSLKYLKKYKSAIVCSTNKLRPVRTDGLGFSGRLQASMSLAVASEEYPFAIQEHITKVSI